MEPACRKDKPKLNSTPTRGDRAKQKSAQQELKQRQRAEVAIIPFFLLLLNLAHIPVTPHLKTKIINRPLNLIAFFHLQIYALNKVMTELEQQQFEAFCKQMQSQGE